MTRRLIFALMVGTLALPPLYAIAQDTGGSEEAMVESAHTKAEHLALAKRYEDDAAQARASAKRHEAMSRAYVGGKSGNASAGANHCKKIEADYEAIAKEYDALAKMHKDDAAKAQ